MDKNFLQKAKAPMIALIQKKNIVENKTKRAFALLLLLGLLMPLASQAFVGSGTETDPYLIRDVYELNDLMRDIKEYYDYEGDYFLVTNDIYCNWNEYNVWGTFKGNLDGGGHTISHFTVRGNAETGLFSKVEDASISNLILNECAIYASQSTGGGIVGKASNSVIENCEFHGAVTSYSNKGGIVGWLVSGSVINCRNYGEVSGTNVVGGIVGRLEDGNVNNCRNYGEVIFSGNRAGGIVGEGTYSGTVQNCVNSGKVWGGLNGNYIGGIIGYNGKYASVCNNLSTGDVRGSGIAGGYRWVSTLSNNYYTQAENCGVNGSDLVGRAMRGYTITGESPIEVSLPEGATVGLAYEGIVYAGNGQDVELALGDLAYMANAGTLTPNGDTWTLTMPAEDVVISINPCATPTNLTVGNLTQETADITWEGSLGNYAVRHRTATHYEGVCIDEPFDTDELPAGWDRYQITSYGSFGPTQFGWQLTTYGLGAYNFRCRLYDPNTNYWLITPGFTVGENYTLSFDVALTDHDNSNPPVNPCNDQTTFVVKITTDNMRSWHTLREWNNSGSEYVLNNIPHTGQNVSGISLADYVGQDVRIAFHCVRTDVNYDWVNDLHIDNVLVGDPVAVAAGQWTDPVAVTGNMHSLTGLTAGTRYETQVRSNLGECDNWSEVLMFKTLEQNAGKFFIYEGNWNEAGNWVPAGAPTASDNVFLRADATIPAGSVAYAKTIKGTDEHTLTLKDGGQLFHYQSINYQYVKVTLEKEIAGYDGSSSAGWYFIGSPVVGVNSVTPSAENGFLVNNYDLYYYDEPTHYWRNHKPGNLNSGFDLTFGRGYLYANDEGTTLKISGNVRLSDRNYNMTGMTHEAEVLTGFNLVGNPFVHNARLNATAYVIDNGAVVAYTEGTKILAPGEGVMVQTTSSSVEFQRVDPDAAAPQSNQLQITVNQKTEQRGEVSSTTLIDNAIINFKDGGTLEKFDFGRADAKVYIPQGGKDYAIVCAAGQNEMPLNFKAIKNGTYTLTFDVENVEFDYLHLIDNLTGADVDLLTPPAFGHPLSEGEAQSGAE